MDGIDQRTFMVGLNKLQLIIGGLLLEGQVDIGQCAPAINVRLSRA
jgi:hypothetical protein